MSNRLDRLINQEPTVELQAALERYKDERKKLNKQLSDNEKETEVIQRELDRRALNAYRLKHPETCRSGDKVMVTEEFNDWYKQKNFFHSGYMPGRVFSVIDVYMGDAGWDERGVFANMEEFISSDIPIGIMQNMRAAYLATNESEQPR